MMLFILSTAIFRDVQVEKGDSEGMHEDPNLLYQLNYCNLRGGNFAPTESETSKNIVFILFMLNTGFCPTLNIYIVFSN